MIIKTYKANTNISINVVLPSKKNLHVSFVPLSDGTSRFTTDNEEVQMAIERHYNYGKLFKLESSHGNGKAAVESKEPTKAVESESNSIPDKNNTDGSNGTETPNIRVVKVTDLAEAKDYLADKFGISRTTIRFSKDVIEKAAELGIEFEGIS